MITKSLRIFFREHLRSVGYTQEEFAGLLNVTPSALSKWINGHNPWPDDAFSKTYTLLALDENQQAEFYKLVMAMREDRFVSIEVDERSSFSEPREFIASHPPLQSPSHTERSERKATEAGGNIETDPWRLQVRQELATLQQATPEDKSNVATIIAGVEKVGQVLTAKHNIGLRVAAAPADQTAIIYPSSLRQVLLTAVEKLVQHLDSGEIRLETKQVEDQIIITVMGEPSYSQTLPDSDLIQELLNPHGGRLAIQQVEDQLSFQIRLQALDEPARQKPVSVLVVDDNPDLITFYQLYVTNTRYQIRHLADGKALFETIATARPDIIVLDVILPDVDGWDLLADLHEHPDTRDIPIIICSVIRREDLALALGAALYLPKPVRRQAFIQALDEVYGLVAT